VATDVDHAIVRITVSDKWRQEVVPKLVNFWRQYIAPEIACMSLKKEEVRDHPVFW
jgi:hypothetical protein